MNKVTVIILLGVGILAGTAVRNRNAQIKELNTIIEAHEARIAELKKLPATSSPLGSTPDIKRIPPYKGLGRGKVVACADITLEQPISVLDVRMVVLDEWTAVISIPTYTNNAVVEYHGQAIKLGPEAPTIVRSDWTPEPAVDDMKDVELLPEPPRKKFLGLF